MATTLFSKGKHNINIRHNSTRTHVFQVVTIYAKPFVYTREIEHEEDEEKCLAESGILCTHHDSKSGMAYQLCHKIPLSLKLHNNGAQNSRKKEGVFDDIFLISHGNNML